MAVGLRSRHEGAVDLDPVNWKVAQVRQRRIAGTKIVHGHRHTKAANGSQHGGDLRPILNNRRLGKFDLQSVGWQAASRQGLRQMAQEKRRTELHGRDVDRDIDVAG